MSVELVKSTRSQYTSRVNEKELRCGGQACKKCGACRDWYQRLGGDDVVKRSDATCNHAYMYRHTLVRHPIHCDHQYYPPQNLICMCWDNY